MENVPKATWYRTLVERFNVIVERHALPESAASDMKALLLDVAREQYMSGNKSGIRWARLQMTESGKELA